MNEAQDFPGSSKMTSDGSAASGSAASGSAAGPKAVPDSKIIVGDLFVVAAAAEFGVEWLVIEIDADRCLVVPVDMASMVGSRDLSLTETTGEPMIARGGHSLWLPARALEAEHRTAELGPAVASAVGQKLASVLNGEGQQTDGLEVDTESAYVEWDLRLTAARSILARQWPVVSDSTSDAGTDSTGDFRTEQNGGPEGTPTSAFAPVTLSHRRLVPSMIAAIFALTCLAGWQQFQLRALTSANMPALTANVPVVALNAEPVRGPRESIVWPTDAGQLLLLLSFYDPENHSSYSLELAGEANRDGPWQLEGLQRLALGELTVTLPRALMSDGRYRLDLSGSDPEKPPFMQSFTFEVISE